jgi:hypothetical protein
MQKSLWLAAGLALTLGACAEMPSQTPAAKPAAPAAANSVELDTVIANAEKEIAAAKKANNLWRDTEKFLKEAKELKAAGNTDEALKKAKKALKEAQLAQKQAEVEANAKPSFPAIN